MKDLLLYQFDLHQKLYNNVLEGFTDDESNKRLEGHPKMNHVKYLAGHLLNSHYSLAIVVGINPEVKWNDLFAVMGQSEAKDDIEYPALEEIRKEWNHFYKPLREVLSKITDEGLHETPAKPFKDFFETKGEFWAFVNHHIAYHIGQIGILRKGFNKPPMSYD